MTAATEQRLAALEQRVARLEAAGGRRRLASAAGNATRSAAALSRARKAAALAAELGWTDSGRRLPDRAIVQLVRDLLAAATGVDVSTDTIRRDLLAQLGRPRRETWPEERRAAAAARRRTLRLAAAE